MEVTQRILTFCVFILFLALNFEAVRVKHSKYQADLRVPDDDQADWPSPDQLVFGLGASLEGRHLAISTYMFLELVLGCY